MPLAFKKRDSRSDSKIENKIRKKRCYGGSRTRNISSSVYKELPATVLRPSITTGSGGCHKSCNGKLWLQAWALLSPRTGGCRHRFQKNGKTKILPTLPKLADFSVVPPAPSNIARVRVFVIKVILY